LKQLATKESEMKELAKKKARDIAKANIESNFKRDQT
jgi:hypothetical protein